jgi:ubiquinone biosynthesis protein UbiJ
VKQNIFLGGHKMAKKVEKKDATKMTRTAKEKATPVIVDGEASSFANLTSAEMIARIKANVKERKRLAEENKKLFGLYKAAKALEKTSSAQAKIEALTAKLEALKNPTPKKVK